MNADTYCKTDLKDRGWTDSMIRRFLGEPDEWKDNPRYPSAAPMRLYFEERVLKAEEADEWIEALAKARKRSQTARASASKRRAQNEVAARELAASIKIEVEEMLEQRVLRQAIDSYNARQDARWAYRHNAPDYEPASPQSDPDFLDRIQVNFLRHECTRYDGDLYEAWRFARGRIGANGIREHLYHTIKNRTLDAIAEAYPHLVSECRRQKPQD